MYGHTHPQQYFPLTHLPPSQPLRSPLPPSKTRHTCALRPQPAAHLPAPAHNGRLGRRSGQARGRPTVGPVAHARRRPTSP